jgi:hypothetical protein
MGQMIRKFLGHVMPGIIRPLRVLWNEVMGFIFLVFAVYMGTSAIRNVHKFQGDVGSFVLGVAAFGFAGLMAYFGIASFLRARRISRS